MTIDSTSTINLNNIKTIDELLNFENNDNLTIEYINSPNTFEFESKYMNKLNDFEKKYNNQFYNDKKKYFMDNSIQIESKLKNITSKWMVDRLLDLDLMDSTGKFGFQNVLELTLKR